MGFFEFFKQADINQGVKEYTATPGAVLLDVRTSEEYRGGHIPGSKNEHGWIHNRQPCKWHYEAVVSGGF